LRDISIFGDAAALCLCVRIFFFCNQLIVAYRELLKYYKQIEKNYAKLSESPRYNNFGGLSEVMRSKKSLYFLIFTIIFSFSAFSSFADVADVADVANDNDVLIAFEAERKGNFLSEPGNVPLEFLRRIGRALNKSWPAEDSKILAASVFDPFQIGKPAFLKPRTAIQLSKEQRKTARQLLDRYGSDAIALLENVPDQEKYILVRLVSELAPVAEILEDIADGEYKKTNIKPEQLEQIKSQLLPIVKAADYMIGTAILSNQGFEAKFRLVSKNRQLIKPGIQNTLSITDYINPDALMVFAQTHPIDDSAEIIEKLRTSPQAIAIQNMIASAGMDLEKDLIANHAKESILYVNLEPDMESGIPDIRFVAPIPDIKKFRSNLDNLKKLCTQLGIFVKFPVEDSPIVHLSYFMFPQYGIYAGLKDRFLILSTGLENLSNEIEFLTKVSKNKISSAKIEKGLQKYWLIKFDKFNLQLQKFLQSPLMVDKGVPPIPNLSLLDDLVHFKITQQTDSEKIDISLEIPVKKSKQK
jgi:hypothetical protein